LAKDNFKLNLIYFGIWVLLLYLFVDPGYLSPDGVGYFAYLPSFFFDGDLHFLNEFKTLKLLAPLPLTKTGYIHNSWSFGAAFFWTPFYLIAKLLLTSTASPYDSWAWIWINSSTAFYAALTFILLCKIQNVLGTKRHSLIPSLAFIGTPMFFYSFVIGNTSHGINGFITTLFIWYWIHSFRDFNKINRYILLGLILGISFMVRQQDAIFGIVVIIELLLKCSDNRKNILKYFLIFCCFFIIGAFPQLLIWKIINGSFFSTPNKFNISLNYFALYEVLFSSFHGLLYWTPIYFFAFAGLIIGCFRKPVLYTGLLLAFTGQVIVNSLCVAFWEGHSFGLRQMTSLIPIVAIGLMEIQTNFLNSPRKYKFYLWGVLIIPCLWTTGLMLNYFIGPDLGIYLSPKEIWQLQITLPFNLAKIIEVLAMRRAPIHFYAIITFISFLLFIFIWLANHLSLKNKTNLSIYFLLATILAYSTLITVAHLNKPKTNLSNEKLVTQKESNEFFINQAEKTRIKYHQKKERLQDKKAKSHRKP